MLALHAIYDSLIVHAFTCVSATSNRKYYTAATAVFKGLNAVLQQSSHPSAPLMDVLWMSSLRRPTKALDTHANFA